MNWEGWGSSTGRGGREVRSKVVNGKDVLVSSEPDGGWSVLILDEGREVLVGSSDIGGEELVDAVARAIQKAEHG